MILESRAPLCPTPTSKTFNTLCSLAERYASLRRVERLLRTAWLFRIDWLDLIREFTPQTLDMRRAVENSLLPTPNMCLEWTDEVVLLQDTGRGQCDWTEPRHFVVLIRQPDPSDRFDAADAHARAWFLAQGEAEFAEGGCRIQYHTDFFEERTLKHQRRLPANDEVEHVVSAALVQALAALEYINSPSRFVVQESRTPSPRPAKTKKIPRSTQRPTYTVLRRPEIRRIFMNPGVEGEGRQRCSPRSHWRRRHYRTLSSPFFKHKKGTRVVIPATWIGPTEAIVDGKQYKVVLDA